MALSRPVCSQCRFFHPPSKSTLPGACHLNPPTLILGPESFVMVPRASVAIDDTACVEFEGLH